MLLVSRIVYASDEVGVLRSNNGELSSDSEPSNFI